MDTLEGFHNKKSWVSDVFDVLGSASLKNFVFVVFFSGNGCKINMFANSRYASSDTEPKSQLKPKQKTHSNKTSSEKSETEKDHFYAELSLKSL